jgi:hypothetical protein
MRHCIPEDSTLQQKESLCGKEHRDYRRSERKHETQQHKSYSVRLVVTVEWVEHLLCIREVPDSYLGPEGFHANKRRDSTTNYATGFLHILSN